MDASSCQGCLERDQRIAALEARVHELEAKVRQLAGRNASNSSTPPSANPPGAPKPVKKEPTGRKPGGQPGHCAQTRVRLPQEMVTKSKHFVPPSCEKCQHALPAQAGPNDREPLWHQVVELPEKPVAVIEYLAHARTCPDCGHRTQAAIPADIRAHGNGLDFRMGRSIKYPKVPHN